jgi:hypothetical protein
MGWETRPLGNIPEIALIQHPRQTRAKERKKVWNVDYQSENGVKAGKKPRPMTKYDRSPIPTMAQKH